MAQPRVPKRDSASGAATRDRIIAAALDTLKSDGFAGASSRAIARTGGFNPALIYYHFGSVNDLLLAALDETSRSRMERYKELIEEATTLSGLMRAAADLYKEDLESGHITVLVEMIAGASAVPDLGPLIAERIQPWIAMTAEALGRVTAGTALQELAPPGQAAFAVASLYLGMELLTHLERDPSKADALFELATSITGLLESLFGAET